MNSPRITIFIFIFLTIFCSLTTAQSNKKDSLLIIKNSLEKEMLLLKAELDSLRNYLASFDEKLNLKKTELMTLRYGKENGARIIAGQVWKGMTEQMLRDSWGEPDKTAKNVEKWGVFTQLYYGEITYFFRDGILTDWEEKKK